MGFDRKLLYTLKSPSNACINLNFILYQVLRKFFWLCPQIYMTQSFTLTAKLRFHAKTDQFASGIHQSKVAMIGVTWSLNDHCVRGFHRDSGGLTIQNRGHWVPDIDVYTIIYHCFFRSSVVTVFDCALLCVLVQDDEVVGYP